VFLSGIPRLIAKLAIRFLSSPAAAGGTPDWAITPKTSWPARMSVGVTAEFFF
jgi:hypothetical protein